MRMCKRVLSLGLLFAIMFFIESCGGNKQKVAPVYKNQNFSELIQRLEKDIANAARDQVNLLAPVWFAKSESSLKAARDGLNQSDETAKLLEYIARGRTQLLSARDKSQISRVMLSSVIENRELARTAGATTLVDDYARVEERFLDLTRAVEKNNFVYVRKNRDRVAEAYRKLEIRAIKIRTIGEIRNLLNRAKRQKTDKIAPQTYAQASKLLQEADDFITHNPHKKEEMQRKANLALFHAQRHREIAEQAKNIEKMAPEPVVLLLESKLYEISAKLSAPDMRDHPFDTQVENILGMITALDFERSAMIEKANEQQALTERLQEQVAALGGDTQAEQTARQRLLADKRFNELFEKVRAYFAPDEAEIFKRQGQVVIRLKAIEFPVGQSVIRPQNYPLLNKVQRVIQTFDDVDVIIAGHTDNTGSEEVNEHLSEQRAEALRHYLVEKETLAYDKIIAVGYGSTRPLASNSTKKGRSINRRIDLIITPYFESVSGGKVSLKDNSTY
jgi:outer membrane protein OmpA-like peptidoglycan-associated protein